MLSPAALLPPKAQKDGGLEFLALFLFTTADLKQARDVNCEKKKRSKGGKGKERGAGEEEGEEIQIADTFVR